MVRRAALRHRGHLQDLRRELPWRGLASPDPGAGADRRLRSARQARVMKIDARKFRVPAGEHVALKKWPTRIEPLAESKKEHRKLLDKHIEDLSALQRDR